MFTRVYSLLICTLVAIIAILFAIIGIHVLPITVCTGLLLAFILPGYSFLTAVFPLIKEGTVEHVLLTLGLSTIFTLISSLTLNLLPTGLNTVSWMCLLGGTTLVASCFGFLQERKTTEVSGFPIPRVSISSFIAILLGICFVGGAVVLSTTSATLADQPNFTQLWALPIDNSTSRIGFKNEEGISTTYKLQLVSHGSILQIWPKLELKADETWQTTIINTTLGANSSNSVEVQLFRLISPDTVYRHVSLP